VLSRLGLDLTRGWYEGHEHQVNEERAVISNQDMKTIYQVPQALHDEGMDDIVIEKMGLDCPPANLEEWSAVVDAQLHPDRSVRIAIVGKYLDLLDAYRSLIEAITHAGIHARTRVDIDFIDAEDIERNGTDVLDQVNAVLVPGGFGQRGFEGKIRAARYAREKRVPYLGICYGLHAAVIDVARNVCGYEGAHSTEIEAATPHPVIGLITEWLDAEGNVEHRGDEDDLGGTMRLGEQVCVLNQGSTAQRLYKAQIIRERHRHRYEVNNQYVAELESNGLKVSGRSEDGELVEMLELVDHPWFVACQFHPEFTSTPRDGHPLFSGLNLPRRRATATRCSPVLSRQPTSGRNPLPCSKMALPISHIGS
jgi:CTP synthase